MAIEWSSLSRKEAEELLSTDFNSGLSKKAVAYRRKRLGKNSFSYKYSSHISTLEKNLFSFSLIALLLSLFVSFFVISTLESVIISIISLAFLVIFALEYLNVQSQVEKSQAIFLPKILTIREGKEKRLFADSLVVGDVIKLFEGECVPFDALLISDDGLELDEELDYGKILKSGAKVKKGSCTCALVDIRTCAQKNEKASDFAEYFSKSAISRGPRLADGVAILSYIATAIVSLVLMITSKKSDVAFESFFAGIIIANGILPCFFMGIYAFLYRSLFFSSKKTKSFHIKNANSVSKLTELDCIVINSDLFFNNDTPTPIAFYTGGSTISKEGFDTNDRRVANFKNALFSVENGILSIDSADKSKALSLKEFFSDKFIPKYPLTSYRLKSEDFPFDTFVFKNAENEHLSVVKGDLFSILKRCISASYNEKGSQLDEASKSAIIDAAGRLSALGLEIEAYALGAKEDFSLDSTHLAHKRLSFLGFVGYSKGLSPESEELFSLCEEKGIEPIIIHNGIKEELNLFMSKSKYLKKTSYLDCKTVGEDEDTIKSALSSYNVFLNPTQRQIDGIIKVVSKNNIKTAYISKQNSDGLLSLKFAEEIREEKTENEILLFDSVSNLFHLVSSSYAINERVTIISRFLSFLSISRISLLFLSLFFKGSIISPLQATIFTFVIDALSLFVLTNEDFSKVKGTIPNAKAGFNLKSILSFLLLPLMVLFVATATKLFNFENTAQMAASLAFYSQLLLPSLYMLFVLKVRFSEKLLAYLFGTLTFITLVSMFSPFGNLLSVISDVKILFVSLLLTIVFLLFYNKMTKNK